jgi:hypothetical protein
MRTVRYRSLNAVGRLLSVSRLAFAASGIRDRYGIFILCHWLDPFFCFVATHPAPAVGV